MIHRPFQQVDVFTATPYLGNALAVVLDGAGLSDAQMQNFARWTNLSETTFLLPPTPEAAAAGADYQVRIFAPGYEMPFAGHPTLGSCHAWLQAGGLPRDPARVVQQCKAGLVVISRTPHADSPGGQRLAFAAPPLVRSAPTPEVGAALAAALTAKQIAGAGLDVWEDEPPPSEHPLMRFDNVLVSPHTAGGTVEARENMSRFAAEQVLEILDGKKPPRLVNPEVWPAYRDRFTRIMGVSPE